VRDDELIVDDVMTPLAILDAVDLEALRRATVSNVIASFLRHGRNHLLVVEGSAEHRPQRVRGIISRAQVERQLGAPIVAPEIAHSFAELERMVSCPTARNPSSAARRASMWFAHGRAAGELARRRVACRESARSSSEQAVLLSSLRAWPLAESGEACVARGFRWRRPSRTSRCGSSSSACVRRETQMMLCCSVHEHGKTEDVQASALFLAG
jgi:hypothetical protein